MPYQFINIQANAADLDALLDPQSEYNHGVRKELALALAAEDMLAALQAVQPVLARAFECDGDVFGIRHNDAVDADQLIREAIAKATGVAS